MTLGNWVPPVRMLQMEVNEYWAIACLFYVCAVHFAVVQIIRAVFMHETFKVAAADDDLMIMQKQRQLKKHVTDMTRFFEEADESGDGFVSFEEFTEMTKDPRVKMWLAAMDFDASNAQRVFELIEGDDGDNRLSAEELVHGVAMLRAEPFSF